MLTAGTVYVYVPPEQIVVVLVVNVPGWAGVVAIDVIVAVAVAVHPCGFAIATV